MQTTMPPIVSKKVHTGLLRFEAGVKPRRRAMSGASLVSAFDSLHMHRVRSIFTMLGIIIGVAALIAVVMMTQGVNEAVDNRFVNLGANVLTISPGSATYQGVSGAAGSAQTLTLADAQALSQVPYVVNMSPIIGVSEQVVYGNKNWNTRVNGVYPSYQEIQNWPAGQGSWFSDQDEQNGAPVAILGQTVVTRLFSAGENPIGHTMRINSALFRIVGVLQSKGQQGTSDADDVIFIPFSAASERLDSALHVQQIQVQVSGINDLGQAQQNISSLLRARHALAGPDPALQQTNGQQMGSFINNGGNAPQKTGNADANLTAALPNAGTPDDFQILSLSQLVLSAQQSATQLTILLIGIAGISLAVGGVGIMNIMLVSVTERTREIGIRIAIGARHRDIRNQFLLEATMLSAGGGVVGILIGLAFGLTLTLIFDLPLILTPVPALAAFGVSACIGIISGLYPALRAARLDPIVAIRQE